MGKESSEHKSRIQDHDLRVEAKRRIREIGGEVLKCWNLEKVG